MPARVTKPERNDLLDNSIQRRILIVGYPRSGTTLLQQLLLTDTRAFSSRETHFLSLLHPTNPLKGKITPKFFLFFYASRQLAKTLGIRYSFNFKWNYQSMINHFIEKFDLACSENEKTIWCEKTPRHLHFVQDVLKTRENIDILIVLREPVAAINSLLKARTDYPKAWGRNRKTNTLDGCIRRWKEDLLRAYNLSTNNNVYFISYDKLIRNHSAVIDAMNKKLRLTLSDDIQKQYSAVVGPGEAWKERNKGGIQKIDNDYKNKGYITQAVGEKYMNTFTHLINKSI